MSVIRMIKKWHIFHETFAHKHNKTYLPTYQLCGACLHFLQEITSNIIQVKQIVITFGVKYRYLTILYETNIGREQTCWPLRMTIYKLQRKTTKNLHTWNRNCVKTLHKIKILFDLKKILLCYYIGLEFYNLAVC